MIWRSVLQTFYQVQNLKSDLIIQLHALFNCHLFNSNIYYCNALKTLTIFEV